MNVARGHVFFGEHLWNLGHVGRISRTVLGGKIFEVTGAEASSFKKDGGLFWRPSSIN